MKRINTHIPRPAKFDRDKNRWIKTILLSPLYWLTAYFRKTPGLLIQFYVVQMLIKNNLKKRKNPFYQTIKLSFMDSVRYFEFDFIWKCFDKINSIYGYLDISSPRLFPVIALYKNPDLNVTMVNPDIKDIVITKELMEICGFTERCIFKKSLIDEIDFPNESYDVITSISVIEHIPGDGDIRAIKKMWDLLKTGGHLLITVPCAREPFEEFMDINEYGLLPTDEKKFVFGQRFYNEQLLADRVFMVTGKPKQFKIFGEKRFGLFLKNREAKNSNPNYPIWQEPYIVSKDYTCFPSIDVLPGWGVIAMEFCKN